MNEITADYIMSLQTGTEIDQMIDGCMKEHGAEFNHPWSTMKVGTILLWDLIELHIGTVGIVRMGCDTPNIISQMASIGGDVELTSVYTGNWIESLCKAFLLHSHGYYGDHMHPEFKKKMDNAPKRIIH